MMDHNNPQAFPGKDERVDQYQIYIDKKPFAEFIPYKSTSAVQGILFKRLMRYALRVPKQKWKY